MAIDYISAKLLHRHRSAIAGARVLTLGRLNFYPTPPEIAALDPNLGYEESDYSEAFLEALGAVDVQSMDILKWEGATIQHDLNNPVPAHLHGEFDAVYDGGTIEHVFDAHQAIRNAVAMVRQGGYLFFNGPANNLMGHGFYQFSPDFWFRAMRSLGCVVEACYLIENGVRQRVFQVFDPAITESRTAVTGSRQVLYFVVAKRILPRGAQLTPLQSDLAGGDQSPFAQSLRADCSKKWRRKIRKMFPMLVRCALALASTAANPALAIGRMRRVRV